MCSFVKYIDGTYTQIYTIDGISALDYYDLYRKFTYTNQERYTLDYIAYVDLVNVRMVTHMTLSASGILTTISLSLNII